MVPYGGDKIANFLKEKYNIALPTLLILAILVGFLIGKYSKTTPTPGSRITPLREQNQSYKFVDPLLAYEYPKSNNNEKYKPLTTELQNIIDQTKQNNQASSIAVYYKDLKPGNWVGIDEDEKYSPASLLKVPLMIAYLKIAESKPEILDKSVEVDQTSVTEVQNFKPSQSIQAGKPYTVNDLITFMIRYSDNDAAAALRQTIAPVDLDNAYTDLGFKYPGDDLGDIMSVKNYSLFFRLLYNGTYLNPDLSESALKILSETDFKQGIVAGIKDSIPISHKFGERKVQNPGQPDQDQLHDCGIIYVPNHPYLLCVMTKGTDFNNLVNVIKNISQKTYEFELNQAK